MELSINLQEDFAKRFHTLEEEMLTPVIDSKLLTIETQEKKRDIPHYCPLSKRKRNFRLVTPSSESL